jgi:alkylation response protein AidB-like acyl-CoA dehydrogenase
MHMQTLGHAAEAQSWPAPLYEEVCRAAVTCGALINSVASEPELGSPSRGGKPKTTATPLYEGGALAGWLLRGRKSFASMAPALDYMIVPALVLDGSETVARFLAPLDEAARSRIEIVETWDALGMRSTGSHDVILHDVCVPAGHLLERDEQAGGKGAMNAWFMLGVSAVYLGVAQAALRTAARYALERVPTALGKPIAELESIRRQLGQAEFLLQQARTVLHATAEQWQRRPDNRPALGAQVAVAKVTATNNAVAAVDACVRAVGGAAMSKALPLERYLRDVRAGLFHPVNDEAAYQMLGKLALQAANGDGRESQ